MSRENPKPFKTIDEQVEILRSRGLGITLLVRTVIVMDLPSTP